MYLFSFLCGVAVTLLVETVVLITVEALIIKKIQEMDE